MKFNSIRITNYKCFKNTKTIFFKEGFNIITGINNSGKSTLLDCLSLRSFPKPHDSLSSKPHINTVVNTEPQIQITASAEKHETKFLSKNGTFHIQSSDAPLGELSAHLTRILSLNHFEVDFIYSGPNNNGIKVHNSPTLLFYKSQNHTIRSDYTPFYIQDSQLDTSSLGVRSSGSKIYDMWIDLVIEIKNNIFLFKAERLKISNYPVGIESMLSPNASNLPQVLHNLQSNKSLFQKYNSYVSSVLPQVKDVSIHNENENRCSIKIWTHDPASERDDLCRTLDECGTGISQVLAILYVVVCSKSPQIILIDEPNSFLHPGAVKKLMEVLKQYDQHQYFITTHSPNVISSVEPSTITLVTQKDQESDFEQIDPKNHEDLKRYLLELGVSLSDVFGADNILWVEGPTEELCFPRIINKLGKKPLLGTSILSVKHTGDFESKKHTKTIIDIYNRLSKGNAIIPPALGFVFDRESRTEKEISDMQRGTGNQIHFLDKMLYENYIIDFDGIAAILNEDDKENNHHTSQSLLEIAVMLVNNPDKKNRKYYFPEADIENDNLLHAANLLSDLFSIASESRVEYRKTSQSVRITDWLIEHKPEKLDGLKSFLLGLLTASSYSN